MVVMAGMCMYEATCQQALVPTVPAEFACACSWIIYCNDQRGQPTKERSQTQGRVSTTSYL